MLLLANKINTRSKQTNPKNAVYVYGYVSVLIVVGVAEYITIRITTIWRASFRTEI